MFIKRHNDSMSQQNTGQVLQCNTEIVYFMLYICSLYYDVVDLSVLFN